MAGILVRYPNGHIGIVPGSSSDFPAANTCFGFYRNILNGQQWVCNCIVLTIFCVGWHANDHRELGISHFEHNETVLIEDHRTGVGPISGLECPAD